MYLELHYDTHFNIIIIGHGLTSVYAAVFVPNEIFIGISVELKYYIFWNGKNLPDAYNFHKH